MTGYTLDPGLMREARKPCPPMKRVPLWIREKQWTDWYNDMATRGKLNGLEGALIRKVSGCEVRVGQNTSTRRCRVKLYAPEGLKDIGAPPAIN